MSPDDPRHGTANGYSNQRCRCDACREAWRLRMIEFRRSHGTNPRPARGTNVTHGLISTYKHGCRCGLCRDKARTERARYRAAQRAREAFGEFGLGDTG